MITIYNWPFGPHAVYRITVRVLPVDGPQVCSWAFYSFTRVSADDQIGYTMANGKVYT